MMITLIVLTALTALSLVLVLGITLWVVTALQVCGSYVFKLSLTMYGVTAVTSFMALLYFWSSWLPDVACQGTVSCLIQELMTLLIAYRGEILVITAVQALLAIFSLLLVDILNDDTTKPFHQYGTEA